jgi:glycosyltransferase involved in cell wall biosynthesis
LRILLLNYEYPPLGGGAGIATSALAHGLAARGHCVDVVTTAPDGAAEPRRNGRFRTLPGAGFPGARLDAPDHGTWPGLRVLRVRSWRKGVHQSGMAGAGGYVLNAARLVRRMARARSHDIVHVFFSLPTGALLPFAGLRGVPIVLSLRGSDVPGHLPNDRRLEAAHRALLPLTRWIWRRADRVVTVSTSLAEEARRTIPDLACGVIWNGVDLDRFRPPLEPRWRRPGPLRCVAVGRLVECKGLGALLRAMAMLGPGRLELEIVGSGPCEPGLRGLAARLGISDSVRFAGALGRDAVADALRRADLYTMAPRAESFGIAFAEALASGLPVVGSTVGGIPEFVEHGRNGFLVPPDDPEALAAAIGAFADDPGLRAEVGARNRAKAEAELSWSRMVDRYLDVYEELLAAEPAAAGLPAPAGAVPGLSPPPSGAAAWHR